MNQQPSDDRLPAESVGGKFVLDELTEVFESLPERLHDVKAIVAASEGQHQDETDRHRQIGQSLLSLVTDGTMPDVTAALVNLLAAQVNPEALGNWYTSVFPDAPRWTIRQWADVGLVSLADRDRMHAGLLEVRDDFSFGYPDATIVFEYLNQSAVSIGAEHLEYSALGIATLWQRRLVAQYDRIEDVADAWLGVNDVNMVFSELIEASSKQAEPWLFDAKVDLGHELVNRNKEFCWIDQLETDDKLWCFKLRDDTRTDLI